MIEEKGRHQAVSLEGFQFDPDSLSTRWETPARGRQSRERRLTMSMTGKPKVEVQFGEPLTARGHVLRSGVTSGPGLLWLLIFLLLLTLALLLLLLLLLLVFLLVLLRLLILLVLFVLLLRRG